LYLCCTLIYLSILFHRNEVHSKHRNIDEDDDNDKGGCEMEYLRNILYEYMMGKQPMVSNWIRFLIQLSTFHFNIIYVDEVIGWSL